MTTRLARGLASPDVETPPRREAPAAAPATPAATGIGLHCFDVFDTLVTRRVWRPEDVFLDLGARLRQAGLLQEAPEAFAARRIAAEAALRAVPGVEEVELEAIHRHLAAALGWDEAATRRAAALEVEAEVEAIRPVAPNARLLAQLQAAGAEVALLSDTYLDRASLLRLLRRAGIAVPPERVFASAAVGATKRTGRLFALVSETLQVPPGRMRHRGDHPQSDLAAPRDAGIAAERCEVAAPTRHEAVLHAATAAHPALLRSLLAGAARVARLSGDPAGAHARALWEVGAGVAGPLLAGFVLWTLIEARRAGARRLHFVSRDGQVLLRIAEILLGRLGWDIECRYLLGSRQAWHLPALERLDEAALSWLAEDAAREPLRSVLARAELTAGRLAPALARHGLLPDSPAPPERLRALLRDAEVEPLLLEAAAARRRLALGYLRQEGVTGGAGAMIVDLGWHGRLQRSLRRLMELEAGGAPVGLGGLYFALRSRPPGFAPEEMRAFVEDPRHLARLNPVLLEIFCAADHGTVRRYVQRADGGFAAELAEPVDRRVIGWGLGTLRAGILAFALELGLALGRREGGEPEAWVAALRDGGMAAYDAFRREPSAAEAEAFGSFPHANGQAHEVHEDCAPRVGALRRLRLGLGLGDPGYAGHWPEASVRRGGGLLGDGLFALKRRLSALSG